VSVQVGVNLVVWLNAEWDPAKARSNFRKHGVRFDDAVAVLRDEAGVSIPDENEEEERWIAIGMDSRARILVVVYVWRGEGVRIISARPANRTERRQYEEGL
jgi:uncharacterized DUF497 family protein